MTEPNFLPDPPSTRTSAYLQDQLDLAIQDDDADVDPGGFGEEEIMTAVRSLLLDSYEMPTSVSRAFLAFARTYPEWTEWLLDDHLSKTFIKQIPQMVTRIMSLEPFGAATIPEPSVNVYVREAVRSYVFGLFQASMALARAAIEHALRQRVPYASLTNWSLDVLIDAAGRCRILNASEMWLATQVQHCGNRVLHGEPCTATDAFHVLVKSRRVLEALYAGHRT